MKVFQIQLTTMKVELYAATPSAACLAALELFPDQRILSVNLAPEWDETPHNPDNTLLAV